MKQPVDDDLFDLMSSILEREQAHAVIVFLAELEMMEHMTTDSTI